MFKVLNLFAKASRDFPVKYPVLKKQLDYELKHQKKKSFFIYL